MGEEPTEDDDLSTVNTNVRVAADHRLKFGDHERAITLSGVEEPRDLVVMINRINDHYGGVTGVTTVSDDVVIVYCDNY